MRGFGGENPKLQSLRVKQKNYNVYQRFYPEIGVGDIYLRKKGANPFS